MLKKSLLFLLILFAVTLVLLMSIWVNLSSDRISEWLEYELNNRLQPTLTLRIQAVKTAFWGAELNHLQLENTSTRTEWLHIESIRVRFNPIAILIAREIPYEIRLYDGKINGGIGFLPENTISFTATDLKPNQNAFLRKSGLIRSDPQLTLSGRFKLAQLPAGTVSLTLSSFTLSGDPQHTRLPLELPSASFSRVEASADLMPNEIKIRVRLTGDITADINGIVYPDWKRQRNSRLDLTINAELTDDYKNRLGFIKNILQGYANPQGRYSLQITGTPTTPRITRL
jgi:type II secretion system protein N